MIFRDQLSVFSVQKHSLKQDFAQNIIQEGNYKP